MAIFITQEELTKMNIAYKATFGSTYVVSTGINKGYTYKGLINGTVQFVSNNFAANVDQAISQFITNNPAIIVPAGISVGVLVDYVTTAAITAFDPVTSTGVVADSNVIGHRGKLIGLATASLGSGFGGQAIGFGKAQNSLWSWTIGDIIYLNGTVLSITPPVQGSSVYSQIIGVATATDTIDVDIKQSFQF